MTNFYCGGDNYENVNLKYEQQQHDKLHISEEKERNANFMRFLKNIQNLILENRMSKCGSIKPGKQMKSSSLYILLLGNFLF